MNIVLLQDRVLVKRTQEENKTASGIILSASAKEKPMEGEVVVIGDGKTIEGKQLNIPVSKGDKIVFGKYSGFELELDKEKYIVLKVDDIIAIKKEDKND